MTHYQNWKDVPKTKWRWKNFSPREMACKGTGSLLVDEVALDKLQELREKLGTPLLITSAYRSPEHNRKVGGAKNSYHMRGNAFDIRMENQDPVAFEAAAREIGFRGIGYYPKQGFMHIDLGPERTWGTPFKRGATMLQPEKEARTSPVQSTTVQATAVQIASGAGAGVAAVGGLSGPAQIAAIVFVGIVVVMGVWILRERLKAWAEGWK
jgi:zinc D-Ala-D-Ala carboxypeptidase